MAPGAIHEELEHAFAVLTLQPNLGTPARQNRLAGVRRLHLSRIHYYLYYRASAGAVDVLAFWHTSRGTEPGLR